MSRRSSAESQQSTKRLRFKRSHASLGISLAILLGMLAVPIAAVVGTSPASATTVPSSQGTDFWLTFESNYEGGTSLFLFISGDTATTGTVSDPAIDFSTTFSVTPGTTTTVDIPSNAEIDSSDSTVADGAVHVTAGAPVSAYGLNTYPETTDGFLGLPTSILGTSYIAEGYEGGGGSQFAVVGTQDGTTVTITPSDATGAYTAGVPYTETLNAGDVYQLIDSSGGDLSGTTVTSNLPVAVFAGNNCADVPTSDGYCNTLAEEMTPTDTWGSDFLTEPLATRSGDTFRFMASENNTTVDVDGSPVATLSADQFYETILTSASSITANNPIQVMQYSNGQDYDNQDADPMDITIPPTEQFLNSYTIATEPSGADPAITQNYLNIVAPTSETSSIDLDGTALPSSDFSPISGSSYSGAQVAVDFGSHTVNAALPFGLSVYGYGGYDAYGYPGGFTLSPIATVAGVALAPTTATNPTGTSACETATVTDSNGNPVAGIQVNFAVTGVNPTTGFAYSGSDGTAQYCYTGSSPGTDTEIASVGSISSNAATLKWTQTTVSPTSVTTSLSGGGQSGSSISVPTGTAVTDTASLSGASASTATGTVTYTVYSDSGCTTAVNTGSPETITTPGTLPASSPVTLPSAGTYYWEASYSGDSANAGSASTCGSNGEVETVTTQPTSVTTSLSGGGQSGISISVPTGTAVTDTASLSGTSASTATGTVTYTVYSDSGCTTAVNTGSPETITTPGTLPASSPVTLPSAGTYYWDASYSGDSANAGSASTCGSNGEVETVTTQPTSVTTSLSGGGQSGSSISVPTGTAVTDTASLSGTSASTATGTVTYTVYSDSGCTTAVNTGSPETITTPGTLPASSPVTLPSAGTYYWDASYSGDSANAGSASTCGPAGEVETVATVMNSTSLSTTLTGGSASGASISVPTGTAVTDTASLSGTSASTATGTVTYTVYSDSGCKDVVNAGTPETITTPGTLPASSPVTLTASGTYYWQASYSGDTGNGSSMSTCGSEVEKVTGATTAQPTSIHTLLKGSWRYQGHLGWWNGEVINVFADATVFDTATLSGANASSATGTVTYTVYQLVPVKGSKCAHWKWEAVASGGTVTVTNGSVPSSASLTLPVGVYEWQATYSGDSLNEGSSSRFGSETEVVAPVPQFPCTWHWGFNPTFQPKRW